MAPGMATASCRRSPERTDGQVRLWPAGVVRIASRAREARFDRGVGQTAGRRRRRRAAPLLCAHAARQARARCRGAAPRSDCPSRPLEPGVAKGPRMTIDRRAIREDGERLLDAARARGRVALATTWFALLWDLVFVGARHDLAQALRALVRSPGVTLGISLLLGLGVAATTTLFAFVDAVLLRPLPYDQPDRLVMMFESNVSQDRLREGPSPGNVVDWVARNDAFDAITAMMTVSATLRGQRRRHADRGRACHARFLRRVSSSTHARAHVPVRTNTKARRRSRRGRRPAANRSSC